MKSAERRIVRVFFALVAVVYFASFPYLQAIDNPNENTRTYLVMALVDHGTWRLDDVVRRFGWTNDMAKVPEAGGGTHFAAVKGPAMTYVGIPIYVAEKLVLRVFGKKPPDASSSPRDAAEWLRTTTLVLELFASHLPGFLFLVWMEKRLRRSTRDLVLRLGTVGVVGLGTNYLAYSFVYVSHAQAAAAAFVGLELVAFERLKSRGDPNRASPRGALFAGLAIGLATLLEYQAAFLSVVLGLYALTIFRRPKTLAAFAAGAGVNAFLLGLFQWASFGNALTPGHRWMETQAFRALQRQGLFGLTVPHADAVKGLLFDGAYGLFATSPWLFLAIPGAALAIAIPRSAGRIRRERRLLAIVATIASVLFFVAVSSAVMWRGGWTIGPRYLTPIVALVALLGVVGLDALVARRPDLRDPVRVVSAALVLASIVRGGVVGIVVSTLPESIERPVAQILLPFLRLAIVPHHVLELVGVRGAWPIYFVVAAALVAGIVTVLPSKRWIVAASIALGALVAIPAFRMPKGAADAGPDVRALFYSKWEPTGRDAIAKAREAAAQDPCEWPRVAKLERELGRAAEAALADRAAARCTH